MERVIENINVIIEIIMNLVAEKEVKYGETKSFDEDMGIG